MGLTGVRSESKSKDSKSSFKRKVEKKLGFYNKVQDAIVKKETKTKKLRSRKKKMKAYNLSALAEFLPDLETLAKTKETGVIKEEKINCKTRQSLVTRIQTVRRPGTGIL
ncbi:Ribosome biogenesis protein SLX9 [Carex littledalei]|uniref:Ribosome biogenesis protein SLX9 n=1 Tax=Carex littledalei TaxID=544730 RepID=A0A833RBV3_9POAL|nr:Ribosome biogenesis protein SLX9 [Carex littledalei]